jgi:DNA-binding GntR family transcriptional regulator
VKKVPVEDSLMSKVGDALRSAILSGELVAGRLYSVQDLAEVLGVSRTPVREALIKLASKGMVRFERNRGVRILQTTPQDLEEVFELRLLLEVPAARLAVARMSDADIAKLRECLDGMKSAAAAGDERDLMEQDRLFHTIILEAAGNHRLAVFVDNLRDLVLTRGVSTAGTSRSLRDIAEEHVPIIEKLAARDADGAAGAMHSHVLHTAQLLIKQEFDASTETVDAWSAEVSRALGRD